ncbi:hypothetical protein PR001_g16544 [Phytophthora rubi]|uniref:AMP-dependent synthetase/ligase domain-containing protein n=1 Tax=Phytophthora rubi TaxID=129364 RepID=A0A6A3KQ67_9STRA|nr:hypothetical protein PR001_g16544 [Phytophthora rubi]
MVLIVEIVEEMILLLLLQRDVTCWRLWRKWSCCYSALEILTKVVVVLPLQRDVGAASTELLPFAAVERKRSAQPGAADSPLPTDVPMLCSDLGAVGDPKRVMLLQRTGDSGESGGAAAAAARPSTELLPFAAVERKRSAQPGAADSTPPTDVPMMGYASGTFGDPKRVVLLQRNLTYAALVQQQAHDLHDEVQISYLLMVRVLERVMLALMFLNGASVGVYHGDLRLLMNDIAALQPTVLVTVPRLVSVVYDTQRGCCGRI